jgi:hypothetical protein
MSNMDTSSAGHPPAPVSGPKGRPARDDLGKGKKMSRGDRVWSCENLKHCPQIRIPLWRRAFHALPSRVKNFRMFNISLKLKVNAAGAHASSFPPGGPTRCPSFLSNIANGSCGRDTDQNSQQGAGYCRLSRSSYKAVRTVFISAAIV